MGTAGDVNGDGYADLVIGARDYEDPVLNEGMAFVYYGNGRSGVALALRQLSDSGRPLALLGRSDLDTFRLAFTRRNPFGRGGSISEIEVKPLGVRFNGHDTFRPGGQWANPVLGSDTSMYAGDLEPGTAYLWRLRTLYKPATTPWLPASRWVTIPWKGWNEEDLRTAGVRLSLPAVFRDWTSGAGAATGR